MCLRWRTYYRGIRPPDTSDESYIYREVWGLILSYQWVLSFKSANPMKSIFVAALPLVALLVEDLLSASLEYCS